MHKIYTATCYHNISLDIQRRRSPITAASFLRLQLSRGTGYISKSPKPNPSFNLPGKIVFAPRHASLKLFQKLYHYVVRSAYL